MTLPLDKDVLADLLGRCEAADCGHRDIDALLEIELRRQQAYRAGLDDDSRAMWKPIGHLGEVAEGGTRYHAPTYSFTVDSALGLMSSMLPGWVVEHIGQEASGTIGSMKGFGWTVELTNGKHETQAQAATLPLAICLCALRALSLPTTAMQEGGEHGR